MYLVQIFLPFFSHKGFMPLSRAATAGKDEIVAYLLGIKGVSPDRSTGEKVTMGKKCQYSIDMLRIFTYMYFIMLYMCIVSWSLTRFI